MGKIGKISVIPKDFDGAFPTMEKSLRQKGMSRAPGTTRMIFPFKELNGKYRTGLDENAKHLLRIPDPVERADAQRRVREIKERLEQATGLDLSPTSDYYNYLSKKTGIHIEPAKLIDGDNIFNLDDPLQAVAYYWLSVDPRVASSLAAYERGEYSPDTHYYVNDEDVENTVQYRKKKNSNDAIIKFDSWSLEKRRKVARLLDLPVSENTREEVVYNLVDTFLKAPQVQTGSHKGKDPIRVFSIYADLKDDMLSVRDMVEDAFRHHVYREKKGGRIFEGELEVYRDKQELIDHLLEDDNQEDLLELDKKLKLKKLAEV